MAFRSSSAAEMAAADKLLMAQFLLCHDQLARETARGMFASIVMAMLGAVMFSLQVKEGLVVTNYGFILGPVVGFMLDQGLATDVGFRDFMTSAGFQFTFASLVGGHFVRYIVTVLLDMFISNPFQDVLKRQIQKLGVMAMLLDDENGEKGAFWRSYDFAVAQNFPSILQSIVGFVTFNAYTNQTRFAWAYASASLARDYRIPPGTIMLSTAIAGVLYLNFYFQMETFSDREYYDLSTKIVYVMLAFLVLYGLNSLECIEAPIEGETIFEGEQGIEEWKVLVGVLLFAFFLCYGLIYPLSTRIGCLAHDAEDVCHMMFEEEHQMISEKMMRAMAKTKAGMNKSRQSQRRRTSARSDFV